MAVAAPAGRAHGDEHRLRARHRRFQIGGEGQAARLGVRRHHIVQPGLEDRDAAGLQGLDLARILVDADHLMAELRQAGAGNQPNIARADHGDTHGDSKNIVFCSGVKDRLFQGQTPLAMMRAGYWLPISRPHD